MCAQISAMSEYEPAQLSRISPTDEVIDNDERLDEWIKENVTTQHHSSGTCKMGVESDDFAVVDEHCNVYLVDNLMVVDASVTVSYTHLTLPTKA